jgi:hypothetical protein
MHERHLGHEEIANALQTSSETVAQWVEAPRREKK